MRTNSSSSFCDEGVLGYEVVLGHGLLLGSVACGAGLLGQVSISLIFSLFLFFLLYIFYFNSNLNHSVLQVFANWSFMKTNKSIMVILNCFD
jgi:hypothetical protein